VADGELEAQRARQQARHRRPVVVHLSREAGGRARDPEVGREQHERADAHGEREEPEVGRPELAHQEDRERGREGGRAELREQREDGVARGP
jgi:hypothetical protein